MGAMRSPGLKPIKRSTKLGFATTFSRVCDVSRAGSNRAGTATESEPRVSTDAEAVSEIGSAVVAGGAGFSDAGFARGSGIFDRGWLATGSTVSTVGGFDGRTGLLARDGFAGFERTLLSDFAFCGTARCIGFGGLLAITAGAACSTVGS
ncbi:MAG: hypothetical protein ACREV2_18955 [Burkholderiales bacterium]